MIDNDVNGKRYISLSLLSEDSPTINLSFQDEKGDIPGIDIPVMRNFLCTILRMNSVGANSTDDGHRFLPGETIKQNIRRLTDIINPELEVLDDPERLQFLITHPDRNFTIHVGYGPEEP